MSTFSYIAPPLSRATIRAVANGIRARLPDGHQPRLDIVRVVEHVVPDWDPEFALKVSSTTKLGADHALTHLRERIIEVREDVYEGAVRGYGRDRFTLAHELGHLILHSDVRLARRLGHSEIKRFQDPEWQANAFAGELLMPLAWFRKIKDPEEAAICFGVTHAAIETQVRAWQREGVI